MRFGQLISFGDIAFYGLGADSTLVTGWPASFDAEYDVGLVPVGRVYPFDSQGLGPAPFKANPTIVYEYVLFAPPGGTDGQAFAIVEAQWRVIWDALQSTYTWGSISGVSGQKGDLIIADADPAVAATYKATARILKPAPWKLIKGQPNALSVEIPFAMLSDFSTVGS